MSNHSSAAHRLYDRAIELPPAARRAFVTNACGSDGELRERVLAMLAAGERDSLAPTSDSSRSAASLAEGADAPQGEAERPGSRIGAYRLLQQIGEGGFGAVFLAEQEEPVVRRVALKIIKLGMDTHQVVARFEQERQALAMMDHPNIARVIDAGATATGRPFFVMDLVTGLPIVEYCDKAKLTIAQRLDLFVQVCGAVQHAHGKGIIHRDIKPSNILVATQDGRPIAKVIDFGIAKATSQKLTDKTLLTEDRQVIGTLQYMSPEQAEGWLDIDTRADVWSLGVVLYELLAGSTPFDRRMLQKASHADVQRMIREVEPQKPSTRIGASGTDLPTIADRRRTEPHRLGGLVRGELDWIVMKALEKDRTRRYETANGLANDVRRHLVGEAVHAAPPSTAYRVRTFLRRNRALAGGVVAVTAALLVGAIGFAWQARIAQKERDDALLARQEQAELRAKAEQLAAAESEQRRLAEQNERKAEAISGFLVEMLGAANLKALGREAKVADVLDRAADHIETAFQGQPATVASVRAILGRTYLSLGLLDDAQVHLQASLESRRQEYGERSVEFAFAKQELSAWQSQKGDFAAAAAGFREALEILRGVVGNDDARTVGFQVDYANALVRLDREAEAEPLMREALAALTRISGRDADKTQIAMNSLAVLLQGQKRLDEAEALYREALAIGQRVHGADHPDTLTVTVNLASLLRERGDLAAAEPLMVSAYVSVKRVYGPDHPRTGGVAGAYGQLLSVAGRWREALPLYEESLAVSRRVEGDQTLDTTIAKRRLAGVLASLLEWQRAIALLTEVVDTYTRLRGAEHRETISARMDLANTLVKDGRFADAETMFRDLLEVCPRAFGPDDPATIIANNSFAVMLLGQGRQADALPFLEKALEVGRRVQGKDHQNTLITELNYVGALRTLGRVDEAAAIGLGAADRFGRVFGSRHPNTANAHASCGQTLWKLERLDEAATHFAEAVAIRKAASGDGVPTFAGDALYLARVLLDDGRADAAETVLREVEVVYGKVRGPSSRAVALAQVELGRVRAMQQRFEEAETLFDRSVPVLVGLLPVGREDVERAERYCADFYAAWQQVAPAPARAAKAAEWRAKVDARK